MTVHIKSVSVQGASGRATEDEDLSGWAELVNDGSEAANVELQFRIDGREVGHTSGHLDPGREQWMSAAVGHLAAGGHELSVVAAVDDGSSSSQVDNGISFVVEAAAPAMPVVELGSVHIQPHTNVDHPAGQAWSNETVRFSVAVANQGRHPVDATVSFEVGGTYHTSAVSVAAGAQVWATVDAGPFAAGEHTVTVSAYTETANQSVLLGTVHGKLTVSDPTAGYRPVNVQVTLHDFRKRPMVGRAVFLVFYGMDGTQAGGAETVEGTTTTGGVLTRPRITIPPRGSLRIMAVSTGEADVPIEYTKSYRLAEGQTELSVAADQKSKEAKIKARSLKGVRDKLSAEAHAGLEIEVLSVGGTVGSENEVTREFETEVEWEVVYGLPSFDVTIDTN